MSRYTKHFSTKNTNQTDAIPGSNQVQNDAGGYSFQVDTWTRFTRFLILGTEGGTYYVGEKEFTIDNAKNVVSAIKEDGVRVVKEIVEVSTSGRAIKNDAALFALALATTFGDEDTKRVAYSAISKVARTGTHLFTFMENVQQLRGWSRGLRTGVSKFYTEKTPDQVAYQAIKYRQRNGWTHKDVLSLAHPVPANPEQNQIFKWMIGKDTEDRPLNNILDAFEEVQKLGATNVNQSLELIREYNLPWEAIPTELLKEKKVWDSLLPTMGLTAMVRNLGKMTSIGVLTSNLDDNVRLVKKTLANTDVLRKSRIHPMQLLIALKNYSNGHGDKGNLSWTPVQGIVDSLNDAFYDAFGNVESTGKNLLVAVDFSGSMGTRLSNLPITAREAAAAMALVTINTEPNTALIGFDTYVYNFPVSAKMRLDDVLRKVPGNGCGTDCSLPIKLAIQQKFKVDAFISLTDTQSWAGDTHVSQALTQYRKTVNQNAKNIEVAMTASGTSNNDPKDLGSLAVVGFDTSTPQAISSFIRE